jgi:hypothetical protein
MRRLLAGGLVLAAGIWVAEARAADPPSPVTPPGEEVSIVSLGRPTPLDAAPVPVVRAAPAFDRNVQPVTFSPALGHDRVLVRAQSPDAIKPLPAGPALDAAPTVMETEPPLAAPPGKLGPPRLMPEGTSAKTAPVPDNCQCIEGGVCCDDPCNNDCCGACGWWRRPLEWLFAPGNCVDVPYCWWVEADYLLWGIKSDRYPPLVTAGTPPILGQDSTVVLFGGHAGMDFMSGARLRAGWWIDPQQCLGIEASGFFLGERSVHFSAGPGGTIGRPFNQTTTGLDGAQDAEVVSLPGTQSGIVTVNATTKLWGADIDLRGNLWRGPCWRVDLLTGFRYFGLEEKLTITEAITNFAPPGRLNVQDEFRTHNNFYGGELGTEIELRRGLWSLRMLGKVALGETHEVGTVNGNSVITTLQPPASFAFPGSGLLAQPTNFGQQSHDRFAVMPEVGIKIGYQLTEHVRAYVGYSLVYISDVIRPSGLIDTNVDFTDLKPRVVVVNGVPMPVPVTIPPGAPPKPQFRSTDFWAQGVDFGMEFRW